jgi:PTH2 family peptidyl-tRNA hydrolase
MSRPVKQVIVMRKDLNMRKGKMVAQGSHASMAAILNEMSYGEDEYGMAKRDMTPALKQWLSGSFTKICLSVDSEQELLDIVQKAESARLYCALITDAGKTEFNGVPTITCCAIGPAYEDEIDVITGHLKLL